jgi:hypothetical protein
MPPERTLHIGTLSSFLHPLPNIKDKESVSFRTTYRMKSSPFSFSFILFGK